MLKKHKLTSFKNCAHLSDDYWQHPVERTNYLVKDAIRKKFGAVRTISITKIVQVLKRAQQSFIFGHCKAIYKASLQYNKAKRYQCNNQTYNNIWFLIECHNS